MYVVMSLKIRKTSKNQEKTQLWPFGGVPVKKPFLKTENGKQKIEVCQIKQEVDWTSFESGGSQYVHNMFTVEAQS